MVIINTYALRTKIIFIATYGRKKINIKKLISNILLSLILIILLASMFIIMIPNLAFQIYLAIRYIWNKETGLRVNYYIDK